MSVPDPTDCPYYLISRATLAVTAELKRELAAQGVGDVRVSYLGALLALWQEDDLQAGDLGRRAGLEPSTMTGLLDRMQRDDLIARHPDPNDRRAQRIRLTAKGGQVREACMRAVDVTLDRVLDGVKRGDLDKLKDTLRQVLSNTNKGNLS